MSLVYPRLLLRLRAVMLIVDFPLFTPFFHALSLTRRMIVDASLVVDKLIVRECLRHIKRLLFKLKIFRQSAASLWVGNLLYFRGNDAFPSAPVDVIREGFSKRDEEIYCSAKMELRK